MVGSETKWHVWVTNEDLETFKTIFSSDYKPSEKEVLEVFLNDPLRFKEVNYG